MSPRAPGRALYIESVTTHRPHVCSELASQCQVRILATGTFILSTEGWCFAPLPAPHLSVPFCLSSPLVWCRSLHGHEPGDSA